MTDLLARIALHEVRVSDRTRWLFVEITTKDGRKGLGEATLQGSEPLVREAAERWAPAFLGKATFPDIGHPIGRTLPDAAFLSAIDQARHDVTARCASTRLASYLGGARRERVPLYANINRRTVDRSPAGFAASAALALDAGFSALKLAPFDEVNDAARRAGRTIEAMWPGLERIKAVAHAMGNGTRDLMVDCHWRFDEASASLLVDNMAALGVCWLECPIAETVETIPAIGRLRKLANAAGIRLAGCEELIGVGQNRPFAEAAAYDVMMPDVKYAGGVGEMMRIAPFFAQHGVAFSPHNPSGPIAHAASLHVSAAVANFDRLEVQFDESDLFWQLLGDSLPRFEDGHAVLPHDPGLGISLDPDVLTSTSKLMGVWNLGRVSH